MAENSSIEWCENTFNPWSGCTKVHSGCAHCYAETLMDTRYGKAKWGPNGSRVLTSYANWQKPIRWNRKAEVAMNAWNRMALQHPRGESGLAADGFIRPHRPRVFCASLADVFERYDGNFPDHPKGVHGGVRCMVDHKGNRLCTSNGKIATQWPAEGHWRPYTMEDARDRLFKLIDTTPYLDWLLLTKRPENIRDMWRLDRGYGTTEPWRRNVWLGTSISTANQFRQIEEIRKCRELAANLFLSIEPLLGPMERIPLDGIDWVIVGGESGHSARPLHPEWVRNIKDQCINAGVAFHFKQWGEYAEPQQVPDGISMMDAKRAVAVLLNGTILRGKEVVPSGRGASVQLMVGKKIAGRMLDGRTWDEFPTSKNAGVDV